MAQAMANAACGDDVFRDDPITLELEAEGAKLLGHEDSVFCPSGTMANQIAARVHAPAGSEVMLHEGCHLYRFEQGGLAALHGIQAVPLKGERGRVPIESFRSQLRPDDSHYPVTRLIVIENSHNLSGGSVLPVDYLDSVVALARELDLKLHVDGARLANAAVALGVPLSRLAKGADSVSLCLSKGLGAPIGTLLAGSRAFVSSARRVKKLLGGGMRQVGVIAAPALIALKEGPSLLADDHARAKTLAGAFTGIADANALLPDTNIVVVELDAGRVAFVLNELSLRGVRALPFGTGRIRFVLHRDVTDALLNKAILAISEVMTARLPKGGSL
jgi:threonine aldolase